MHTTSVEQHLAALKDQTKRCSCDLKERLARMTRRADAYVSDLPVCRGGFVSETERAKAFHATVRFLPDLHDLMCALNSVQHAAVGTEEKLLQLRPHLCDQASADALTAELNRISQTVLDLKTQVVDPFCKSILSAADLEHDGKNTSPERILTLAVTLRQGISE